MLELALATLRITYETSCDLLLLMRIDGDVVFIIALITIITHVVQVVNDLSWTAAEVKSRVALD